ncbi:MAG: guanylate kinase [Fimbriimonadaceae bacterium]|nr:guanylate kinase [Fimbriimonadaceae bacterium]QYK56117.1 MAG: guanylate kinase [Fimbriimonadaceae bacterium]
MAGKLVILSGPSGVGKDTVIEAWRQRDPRVERVVATCTRAPREGEVQGTDYDFVSHEHFHRMAAEGRFLEFKEVHGNWYATPLAGVEARLAAGKVAVLKIDVQGALEVMRKRPEALTIFLLPPSLEELERRIRSRGQDDEATIQRRLEGARRELACVDKYRHQVVNDDLATAVTKIMEAVGA